MAQKRTRRFLVALLGIGCVVGFAIWSSNRPEPADTRFSGAYAMSDGTQIFISPNTGTSLRYRLLSGETGVVWPLGDNRFAGGSGWEQRTPITNRMTFTIGAEARPTGFRWDRPGDTAPLNARRIDLPERIVTFANGPLTMRGKLVEPQSDGPFPAVVIVHGGEQASAVDYYSEPYLYAANGFAAFVFDKRGTGESGGEYLQNFSVLADDVRAAIAWLRDQDHIDDDRINLAGFSQGGWVAPLAALRDGHIRSFVINYGPLVSVADEDRWGYVNVLQKRGFGADAIAKADRINVVLEDIASLGKNRWGELASLLEEVRHEPWAQAISGSDCGLGRMLATKEPMWASRLFYWWYVGRHTDPPFIQWSYEPVPTMAALTIPSLWILGGEDSSMPTQWTLEEITKLQADGKPIESKLYRLAEHGMLLFEEAAGHRRIIGYEPEHFPFQIEWLKRGNNNCPHIEGRWGRKVKLPQREFAILGATAWKSRSVRRAR
jgi:dienelactone hydrolase